MRRALPILVVAALLAGCGSSGRSDEQAFTADVQSFCDAAKARAAALPALPSGASATERLTSFDRSWAAADKTMAGLAELHPPDSTGVTATEWSTAVGKTRRDLHAYRDFYVDGYRSLLQSIAKSAPGAPVTAAAIFNSAAGQRFLREQSTRDRTIVADTARLAQLGAKIEQATGSASLTACAGLSPAAPTTTTG